MIRVTDGSTYAEWSPVELIDHMGGDDRTADAARVSMLRKASEFSEEKNNNLIRYLAHHEHWTPFAHSQVTMLFRAPFAISEQFKKHQVGMVWNEVSRRYVDTQPWVYVPEAWRSRPDNVKQGSDPTSDLEIPDQWWLDSIKGPLTDYQRMLSLGIAPEQARFILPTSTMTEWYWTGSLYAWFNMYQLRVDSHAQQECRPYALAVREICQRLFPVSWEQLTSSRKT
tara:strand:- start:779 stop:1456 length:678 start_codon:yes stop_codon:yes gene_type:complete